MYAFVSRVAAFTNGAASVPLGVVTAYDIINNIHCGCCVAGRRYLIGDEETSEIVVSGKGVDYGRKGLVLRVRPLGIRLLDLSGKSIDIQEQVNSRVRERLHTSIVISRWINVIR